MTLALSLSVVVPEPIVVLVEVDNLDTEDLASLEVARVVMDDRVHELNDAVGFLVVGHVLGVRLELAEDALVHVLIQGLFEEGVFHQEVEWSSRVAIDLSDEMRKFNSILLLSLIDELVQDLVLAYLKSSGLDLSMLLSV